ncbi:MAG TPA: hypothetical protein VMJ90_06235 [Anaerolineales bacterium]|nr:hypothetical protein [Anaerolineales bacterium]
MESARPILRRYLIVWRAFWTGESKTAHERINRYAGGFALHFSHKSTPLVGIPQVSQKGFLMIWTRFWHSGHQREPALPHPPHAGGNTRSSAFQVNRWIRYDQGILLT